MESGLGALLLMPLKKHVCVCEVAVFAKALLFLDFCKALDRLCSMGCNAPEIDPP